MRISHVALSLAAFGAPMIAHSQQLPAHPQIQVFENPVGPGGAVRLQKNPERVELNRTALARLHSTLVRHSIVVGFTNAPCDDLALEKCMEAFSERKAVNRAVAVALPLDSWPQTMQAIDGALTELAQAEKDQARLVQLRIAAVSARATVKRNQEIIDNNPDPGVPKEISGLSEKHAGRHDGKIKEIIADQLGISLSQVRETSTIADLGGNDEDLASIATDIEVEIGTITQRRRSKTSWPRSKPIAANKPTLFSIFKFQTL